MAECLGRYIRKLVEKGEFCGLKPSSADQVCSHQQFVDDSIIMGKASVQDSGSLNKALDSYGIAIGQLINWSKSFVYFINTLERRQIKISKILGCQLGNLPASYLGLPLCQDPPDTFWGALVDKFHKKLAGWKGSLLSQAGNVHLLKSTLRSIPLYAISIFRISAKFAEAIEKIQRTFLWRWVEEKKKMNLIP
ncbi:uncharacterized protein LOC131859080 [Cryptomeria japonica]|uniref:uncharacterized protein LOC131859080 n=1 Tax=Cryptomeria japonica TaxID=3369 RepID=UPI0027DA04D9|nr:uncharacterized protein LOC131859080 [Cryptomeria japonica]